MTLNQLKCFITLAKELNYAKAAKALYITQPAVSHHIQALEAELGVQLFLRSSRSVSLTPAGISLYHEAEDILRRVEQAALRAKKAGDTNVLNIGCVNSLQISNISAIFRKFKEAEPSVFVNMHDVTQFSYKQMLADGKLDLVFTPKELVYRTPDCEYDSLFQDCLYCVVAKDHPLAERDTVIWDDLDRDCFILLDNENCPPLMSSVQQIIRENCPRAAFNFSASATYTIPMIVGGLGIAIMPGFVIPYTEPKIRCIVLDGVDEINQDFEYGIVYPKGELSVPLRKFIQIIRDEFRE